MLRRARIVLVIALWTAGGWVGGILQLRAMADASPVHPPDIRRGMWPSWRTDSICAAVRTGGRVGSAMHAQRMMAAHLHNAWTLRRQFRDWFPTINYDPKLPWSTPSNDWFWWDSWKKFLIKLMWENGLHMVYVHLPEKQVCGG